MFPKLEVATRCIHLFS